MEPLLVSQIKRPQNNGIQHSRIYAFYCFLYSPYTTFSNTEDGKSYKFLIIYRFSQAE